jgi:uncharacterized membrane protein HdeD (DUF308 family)
LRRYNNRVYQTLYEQLNAVGCNTAGWNQSILLGIVRAMQDSTRKKVGPVIAYVGGCVLILYPIMGFLNEFLERAPLDFYDYVVAAGIIVGGLLTCLASVRAMHDSMRKKVGTVSAYVVGCVLIICGILGLLYKFGKKTPYSTNFYGYVVPAIFLASGVLTYLASVRAMQDSTRKKAGPVSAYIIGGVLTFLGIVGLLVEFGKGNPSSRNFYGHVLAAILVASGVLTCAATRLRYGGGLWSFVGLILVVAATARLAQDLQMHARGRDLAFPEMFYSTTAALWGAGCYCLVWGHMRHQRQKACSHETAPPQCEANER